MPHSSSRRRPHLIRFLAPCALTLAILGCSPTYNWRTIQSNAAPFTVLLPAKPQNMTRPVKLESGSLDMTMTVADADDAVFAVGSAEAKDAVQAQQLLPEIKAGLLKNLQHPVIKDAPGISPDQLTFEATTSGDAPRNLHVRLIAHGKWIYQLMVVAPPGKVAPEEIDTFMTSFVAQ
jgi:hypothetical protein